jgi:hypothetical protein
MSGVGESAAGKRPTSTVVSMLTEHPNQSLIEGEGHRNGSAESSRNRIDAAFALMAEYADQWDDLLYGPGEGPPPPPEREPVKVGERPASFSVVP